MEGVLSKGVLSGNGLCLEGVMYGGGFVRRVFCPRTVNPPLRLLPVSQCCSLKQTFALSFAHTHCNYNKQNYFSSNLHNMNVNTIFMIIDR